MKRSRWIAALLTVSVAAAATAAPLVQEMGMPAPQKEHEMLLKGVGKWEGTITMMMPGMPSEPTPASEEVTALGQFWTTSHFKTSFMGMPFEGHGQFGYDPEKGEFVGTWIDSMQPAMALMSGEYDEENNALHMRWMAPDMTGQMVPHRSVNVQTENSYKMEFFQGEGEGTKTMEIEMKREPVEASAGK